jgi:tetratricopeptide (TPR) repeat protein
MKGKDTMKTAVWMLAVWMGAGALAYAADEQSPAVLLQEALYQEETEGDLDKAIEIYLQVIEQAADVERVTARATYQLGVCHLKKGETEEAAQYFREVINQYALQVSTVKKAKQQLEKITPDERVRDLVEGFFENNYRDITTRETLEWGEAITEENGNISIRYKYEATIWGKDKIINDETFTFDADGKFVSVQKQVSPEKLKSIVEKAVLTISTCSESDPRVAESLKTLEGLDEASVVSAVTGYLDENKATIRRSAIYILWRGGFSDISSALENLRQLCGHEEEATRGMATLALGKNKDADAYDLLVAMTLDDESGFARRCGAYALGLLGDPKALEVLEKAKQDEDANVRNNAEAAITMLTKLTDSDMPSPVPDQNLTQKSHSDIQPDGTILFKNPKTLTNNGNKAIEDRQFVNSDFVELTAMSDLDGNPVPFDVKHEGNIYRYHITFEKPIEPGESFTYVSEGTISGLISPVTGKPNTYRYFMNHSPETGAPTLRIETYLLPEGAEVVSTVENMEQEIVDGRIQLRIEKVIPAGGRLLTSFQYKLQ